MTTSKSGPYHPSIQTIPTPIPRFYHFLGSKSPLVLFVCDIQGGKEGYVLDGSKTLLGWPCHISLPVYRNLRGIFEFDLDVTSCPCVHFCILLLSCLAKIGVYREQQQSYLQSTCSLPSQALISRCQDAGPVFRTSTNAAASLYSRNGCRCVLIPRSPFGWFDSTGRMR